LGGLGPVLAKGRVAHNLGGGQGPAVLLLFGELVAKGAGVVAEGAAHELAGGGDGVARDDQLPQAEPEARAKRHGIS